jgi:hypothetical protein
MRIPLRKTVLQSVVFGSTRFAAIGGLCIILSGCGSINIPLGSLWSSSSSSNSPKTDEVATGSITPGQVTSKASLPEKSSFFSSLLPSFGQSKTAEAKKPDNKPFTLDAPAETTGSIPPQAAQTPEEPKTFAKEDHDAVQAILAQVLPEKGGATSQAWANSATGYNGMVVPLAQLKKSASVNSCRELLISFGKGNHKDWYKGQGCHKGGKWQLSEVTPWRASK